MDFGDVLLHFLELVGSEHRVGVFLSVDDLLLEGVERLVPRHGRGFTAPRAEGGNHDRVVGHADLEALEVFNRTDGVLAVAQHAEALHEPAHGHVAALGDHALVDLVPVLVDELVAIFIVGEHVRQVEHAH